MRLTVAGQPVRCPVCHGDDFSRRHFFAYGRGAFLQRRARFAFGQDSRRIAWFYACERCSWTATFAGDTASSPQEQG